MRCLSTTAALLLLAACTGKNQVSDEIEVSASAQSDVARPLTLEDAEERLNGMTIQPSDATKPPPAGTGAAPPVSPPHTYAQVRHPLPRTH